MTKTGEVNPQAELLASLDPECLTRGLSLTLAQWNDKTGDHQKVLSVAASYLDFIDPFALDEASEEVAAEQHKLPKP